jgi:hypothetical protein
VFVGVLTEVGVEVGVSDAVGVAVTVDVVVGEFSATEVFVGVAVGLTVAVEVEVAVPVPVAVAVGVGVLVVVSVDVGVGVFGTLPWQAVVPESVKVLPASGTNRQLKLRACKVSLRTPYVEALRTRLFAAIVVMDVWSEPPVPTMNSGIPRTGSRAPVGVWGAKRSYIWS